MEPNHQYHALGYGKNVLGALAFNGGHRTDTALGAVDIGWAQMLVDQGLAVRDPAGFTLTDAGWETFRAGTDYTADYYGPGLIAGQRVSEPTP